MITGVNHELGDTKVSIDPKRILRIASTFTLCCEYEMYKHQENRKINPFDDAVPDFVLERIILKILITKKRSYKS